MTKTGQDIGLGDEPYHAGDSLDIVFTVTEDGSAKNLTGANVVWKAKKQRVSDTVFDSDDSGISASVTDASAGEVTVDIDSGVTDGKETTLYHELRVTDSANDKAVVSTGKWKIIPRVTD